MTVNISQLLSTMTTRQKITAGVFAVIIILIIWEVISLFGGGGDTSSPTTAANQSAGMGAAPQTPQPATLSKQQAALSPREAALVKLQQETEAKYVVALNQLQMLKIAKDIAETNQSIMTARLATVTAQKSMVDLLTKPVPPPVSKASYAQGLVNPTASGSAGNVAQEPPEIEVNYTVIAVSQLQNKWGAVLGYQGKLYGVSVGDILPPDESRVLAISKSGVILLDKNKMRRKVSLVSII
jgi:hypothetical protein